MSGDDDRYARDQRNKGGERPMDPSDEVPTEQTAGTGGIGGTRQGTPGPDEGAAPYTLNPARDPDGDERRSDTGT